MMTQKQKISYPSDSLEVVLKHTLQFEPAVEIHRLNWSPDGRYIALPLANGRVRIWDIAQEDSYRDLSLHVDRVYGVAWSPNQNVIATISRDGRLIVWDIKTDTLVNETVVNNKAAFCVVWSPNGRWLAFSVRNAVWVMDTTTYEVVHRITGHQQVIYSLVWSHDGEKLASASSDKIITVWQASTWKPETRLSGHAGAVIHLAWSPDDAVLASSSADRTISLWNTKTWKQAFILEAHTSYVNTVSFSGDGQLLASKSGDGNVRLWHVPTSKSIHIIEEKRNVSGPYLVGMQFHPHQPLLASVNGSDGLVNIWDINTPHSADGAQKTEDAVHYINAKVVLIGDTGVGKSGLSIVLNQQPFQITESTHSRKVILLNTEVNTDKGIPETRETLLWDLAGQPGYRLIHQLHLDDVSLALVVYDSRQEVDPLAGVRYWIKALRQTHRSSKSQTPLKIFLVAARVDRGTVGISRQRIEQLIQAHEIDGHFETSAKEGWGIPELQEAIKRAIDWSSLPCVSSTALFNQIKQFIITQREHNITLLNFDSLYLAFMMTMGVSNNTELQSQVAACIDLMASRGLVERLSFGNLILLQPELIDSYASAFVNAAKEESDGLGYIREEDVLSGNLRIPSDFRVKDKEHERLFLIATVEKLLRHEIALRVQSNDSSFLVFPSQLTKEKPDFSTPTGKIIKFRFEGVLLNIYATLIVRLAQSGLFTLKEMWKNAAVFTPIAHSKGEMGIYFKELSETEGEMSLFISEQTSDYAHYQFEEYVHNHLKRRAVSNTVKQFSVVVCPDCNYVIPDEIIILRQERGMEWIDCPVCNKHLSLAHATVDVVPPKNDWIRQMNKVANTKRDYSVAVSTINGKIATQDYDVFLCHNSADKQFVKAIGVKLRNKGLLPWLDEWELRPGVSWQNVLEEQLQRVKAAAVFVGSNGIGPWQDMEQAAFIREFVRRQCPVIPIILPTCENSPELPYFLSGMTWVDFRQNQPDPLQRLIWGITGNAPIE